jgi:hypothetical protein
VSLHFIRVRIIGVSTSSSSSSALDSAVYGGKSEKAAHDNYKGLLHPLSATKTAGFRIVDGKGMRAKPQRGTDRRTSVTRVFTLRAQRSCLVCSN